EKRLRRPSVPASRARRRARSSGTARWCPGRGRGLAGGPHRAWSCLGSPSASSACNPTP
nr:hypothetical protein [Tanacetum cinerariifolium]